MPTYNDTEPVHIQIQLEWYNIRTWTGVHNPMLEYNACIQVYSW